MKPLPAEIDAAYYRSNNPDLTDFSDPALVDHYWRFGCGEGRCPSQLAKRQGLLDLIETTDDVLEIGPFTAPCARGPKVKYFDILDRTGLIDRATQIGYPIDDAPEIDFVSQTSDLTTVNATFDIVFSCHCIEHQPDLVRHLNEVAALLKPNGAYLLVIPDKRFIFDHYIPESTIAGVLEAHRERRRIHRLSSVVEHRALVTHNDPVRHWKGDHGTPRAHNNSHVIQAAMDEYDRSQGKYVDVHAWQFTPHGFRVITQQLHDLGLTKLSPTRVWGTPRPSMEFCAILSMGAFSPRAE
jgi:SAM-dependent methyltransferase